MLNGPSSSPSSPSSSSTETPAWSLWLSGAIALGGLYLVAKTSPMSQGEWNEQYGAPRKRPER